MTKFIPQRKNANKHTLHGTRLLEKSITTDGFIDAQTAAADGEIISGSARLELFESRFADDEGKLPEPIIVESDGSRPVIIVRTDIPNADDPRAKRLSVAANQIAHTDYNPDGDLLKAWGNEDKDIKAMFAESEWTEITGEEKPTGDADPPAGINAGNQYGVIVICDDEPTQEEVYNTLLGMGYKVKVVVV